MYTVKIDGDRCLGCRLCAIVCEGLDVRSDVLAYVAEPDKLDNVKDVIQAGANVIVAGSSVFNEDISMNIENFYKKFKEATHE